MKPSLIVNHCWLRSRSNPACHRRKRRKVQKAKAAKRVRPHVDNDQTRKLRSALTEDEPSTASGVSAQVANGFAHNSMQGSESAAAAPASEELTDEDDDEMDSQSRRMAPLCRPWVKLCLTRLVLLNRTVAASMPAAVLQYSQTCQTHVTTVCLL